MRRWCEGEGEGGEVGEWVRVRVKVQGLLLPTKPVYMPVKPKFLACF